MLTTVVAVILVLGLLIFFHELGHFSVARFFGMGVSTFSLGFGPKLLKRKVGKTEYALSLVPLGGYVALVGETDDEIPEGFTEDECFSKRPAWQRLLVVLAGPIANFLLAWILYCGLALFWGTPVSVPEVGAVQDKSPAKQAGIMVGDTIVSVSGTPIHAWGDLSSLIGKSAGNPMDFEIVRKQDSGTLETIHLTVSAQKSTRKTLFGEEEEAWLVGIVASGKIEKKEESFFSAIASGSSQTLRMMQLTWQGFVKLIERVIPADQVGGPIMIAKMVGDQAKEGLAGLLALTALISVNLGILNLLPVPVLDGGTAVFCTLEILLRRPIHQKIQEYAMRVGVCLLVALMIFATFNDVMRFFKS